VAGHGKDAPKDVTHAEETQSIVDFVVGKDLTDFILVGHGYAGTIISKVVEVIPERVRRLVFWSAYVLNDGETALEMLPDTIEMLTQMAADSADNTFMIPFDMWRDVFINDGDPDLVQSAYDQLSPEPFGPWAQPLNMEKADVLVLGSAADGKLGQVVVGSTADRMLHSSPVPLTISPRGYRGSKAGGLTRITAGYPGTPETLHVVERVAALAERLDARRKRQMEAVAVEPATDPGPTAP